ASSLLFLFITTPATSLIDTLSLHDALPICGGRLRPRWLHRRRTARQAPDGAHGEPEEVLGGIRRFARARYRHGRGRRRVPARRGVVDRGGARRGWRLVGHARGPGGGGTQTGPQRQRHEDS